MVLFLKYLKQKKLEAAEYFSSPIKYSNVSAGLMKLPYFEWKQDTSKGTKTAEFYLNILESQQLVVNSKLNRIITKSI